MDKKSIPKRIGVWASGVLVVAIVALCAFMLITKASNDVVFIGNRAYIYVVSQSMEPLIPTGSFIVIEKADATEVKVGDIITFKSDDPSIKGSLNTHKVIEIIGANEEFVTQGVNEVTNSVPDAYTAKSENVLGKYVRNSDILTFLIGLFLTKAGLIITIIAILLICCAVYVPDIVKNIKRDKADEKQKLHDQLVAEEVERLKRENAEKESEKNSE